MHRMKMPLVLGAGVALLGLAAVLFSTFSASNGAQASTPDGAWKLVGTSTDLGQKTPAVWNLNVAGAKAGLVKGALVVTKSNPANPANDHPNIWRVIAYKDPKLTIEKVQGFNCNAPAAPAGVPGANLVNVYTGPCNKTPVGTGPAADLSGVSDLIVDAGVPGADLFHCQIRTDISNTGAAKNAAVCFDNTGSLGTGDAGEPINDVPGEGLQGPPTGFGPPPPPPYAVAPPAKGTGTYAGDNLDFWTCFPDVGTSVNILSHTTVAGAHAQLTATGKIVGTTALYSGESNAACDALTPVGAGAAGLGLTIYPALDLAACPGGVCQHVPWRTGGDTDWDNDGCTDGDELWQDKPGASTKCGDDPWNPFDVTTDASGSYSLTAIAARQDCNPALTGVPTVCDDGFTGVGDHIGGFYYDCTADINQTGKALTARVSCYIDARGQTVSPQNSKDNTNASSNPKSCGAAPTQAPQEYCGDGVSGAPPPGNTVGTYPTNKRLFADVDDKHTVLTGTVDNAQNVMKLAGCFEDRDGFGNLGNVYVDAVINLHTGHGAVKLWSGVTPTANCTQVGGPGGSPTAIIPLHISRQAAKATPPAGRDSDGDGCPNKAELGDNPVAGGLRDPINHYDYMEATQNGQVRIPDIVAVVGQYFIDDLPGPIDMKSLTDRTAIVGGNAWNLGPPNGQQRIDDILAQVKQYFHDC